MGITPEALVSRVQVNIPFPFLFDGYLDLFLRKGLNPEIGLDAWSLNRYPPAAFRGVAGAFHQAGRRLTLHAPAPSGFWDGATVSVSRFPAAES